MILRVMHLKKVKRKRSRATDIRLGLISEGWVSNLWWALPSRRSWKRRRQSSRSQANLSGNGRMRNGNELTFRTCQRDQNWRNDLMPQRDGTGPGGEGPGTGRGLGMGGGRGRMGGNKPGSGPGGNCVCPDCGQTFAHETGVPCNSRECPKCGVKLVKQ